MSNANNRENSDSLNPNQIMYLYQVFENQQSALMEQLSMLKSQIQGVNTSIDRMKGIQEVGSDHEILVALGANAFTYAKLQDPNKILTSVGPDILIEKTLGESIESMQALKTKYQSIQQRLTDNLNDVNSKLEEIRPLVQQISRRPGN